VETLLIAVLLAWVAMMFEAIAWGGLDNLALPLIAHLLLQIYLSLTRDQLEMRLLVTAVLWVFVLCYQVRTTLKGSAVLGAILIGYICWALGDWPWVIAPTVLFLGYTLLSPRTEANSKRIHDIHAVLSVSAAPLLWLFLSRLMHRPEFQYLFTLAFAAQVAIIGVARLGYDYAHMPAPALLCVCIMQAWVLQLLPFALIEWSWTAVMQSLFALPAIAVAGIGFYFTQPQVRDCPANTARWLRQAGWGAVSSAMGLIVLYLL
jgi:phytol kinase